MKKICKSQFIKFIVLGGMLLCLSLYSCDLSDSSISSTPESISSSDTVLGTCEKFSSSRGHEALHKSKDSHSGKKQDNHSSSSKCGASSSSSVTTSSTTSTNNGDK